MKFIDVGKAALPGSVFWASGICLLRCAAVIGLCILCAGCSTWSAMPRDASDKEARRYARSGDLAFEVDALAKPLVEKGVMPGMVVGVLKADGSSQFFAYGVADKRNEVPLNADTLFSVGSLSKGFLGAMTAQMVEEGVLSWNSTLEEILPVGTPLSEDAKKITVEQLATHTSGLPRQPMSPETMVYFLQYLFTGEDFYRQYDSAYIFDYLSRFRRFSGVTPQYSNIGYGVLGYIVELKMRSSLDKILEQKICQPLGLFHTVYGLDDLPPHLAHAQGYVGDQPKFMKRGEPAPDWKFTGLMKGSAAIQSSARDLLVFSAAHLRKENTRLSAALADTLRVRYPREHESAAVAWFEDLAEGQRLSYQIGFVGGYTSYQGIDARHGLAVVVLQNGFNWSENFGHQLLLRMARSEDFRLSISGS